MQSVTFEEVIHVRHIARGWYLKLPDLVRDPDSVERKQYSQHGDTRERRGSDDLPDEKHADDDEDRDGEEHTRDLWEVLQALRVDRHQVDYFTDCRLLSRRARQTKTLIRRKCELSVKWKHSKVLKKSNLIHWHLHAHHQHVHVLKNMFQVLPFCRQPSWRCSVGSCQSYTHCRGSVEWRCWNNLWRRKDRTRWECLSTCIRHHFRWSSTKPWTVDKTYIFFINEVWRIDVRAFHAYLPEKQRVCKRQKNSDHSKHIADEEWDGNAFE